MQHFIKYNQDTSSSASKIAGGSKGNSIFGEHDFNNNDSIVGKTIRGKKIVLALDLKYNGKLKPGQ